MDQRLNNVLFPSQLRRPPHVSASCPAAHGPARPFRIHHAAFGDVLGPSPSLHLLASTDVDVGGCGVAYFHEAGVYHAQPSPYTDSRSPGDVYITSNLLQVGDDGVTVEVCKLTLPPLGGSASSSGRSGGGRSSASPALDDLRSSLTDAGVLVAPGAEYSPVRTQPPLVMPNGATAFKGEIIFCTQGQELRLPKFWLEEGADPSSTWFPSALVSYNPSTPSVPPRTILNNFHGRTFNSLNDVAEHRPSSTLFFTDPDYGYEQGFKSTPQLPNCVWRFDPADGGVQMAADGFGKPNGVVFSPDGLTCYVTDTDFIHGGGDMDGRRAGTIYAFDVRTPSGGGPPQLHSRRVFAFVDCGAPDGIKCDEAGNVYTGCFDGVHVFAPSGLLIGKILLPPDNTGKQRGCANLVFGPRGRLIILSETTVWEARLAAVGDLKGIV